MLEIYVNDNEFNEIKNSFIYDYSYFFVGLELTNIIQEWNKFKDKYFICFSTNKNEKIYCELLGINITMEDDELKYNLRIKSKYIADSFEAKEKLDDELLKSFEKQFNVKHLGRTEI